MIFSPGKRGPSADVMNFDWVSGSAMLLLCWEGVVAAAVAWVMGGSGWVDLLLEEPEEDED